MKKTMFNKIDFPEEYPTRLRRVSWIVEGKNGIVCGIYPYYNKHLPYSVKGDECFLKQCLLDYFYKNGCPPEVCGDICQYFSECFSVQWTEGADGFVLKCKKDEDKKVKFDFNKFRKMFAENAEVDETKQMIKSMSNYVLKFYNSIMKAYISSNLNRGI